MSSTAPRRRRWAIGSCAGLAATLVLPLAVMGQTPPTTAASRPELQAALTQVDAGDTGPLLKLAEGGDAEAQYFAGLVYLFGRGAIPKDPPRGCAFEEKASATRGDAMHLVGMCYQSGAGGVQDKAKAEAAFTKAASMGFLKSKCALGQMLMAEPQRAPQGLALCEEAATAGDVEAQMSVAAAYFSGAGATRDQAAARKWYGMAAKQNNADANRRLGEMYARGDGGSKDEKKAMEHWLAAEKAGDPLVSILIADQLFSKVSGGRAPGPGTYAFKGGIPVADIQVVEEWYKQALDRDPRPDMQQRAKYALAILSSFKTAANSSATSTKAKPSKR